MTSKKCLKYFKRFQKSEHRTFSHVILNLTPQASRKLQVSDQVGTVWTTENLVEVYPIAF